MGIMMRGFLGSIICVLSLISSTACATKYTNPIIPGWHSDPSCIFVPEWDDTFFCTTSTFLAFPGIPIYASKDLTNWKLVSHALSRPAQAPRLSNTTRQSDGIFASTLRFRNGILYLATALVYTGAESGSDMLLFTSTSPYADIAWSDPITIQTGTVSGIDPDLFWDDDDQLYVTISGSASFGTAIMQSPIDTSIWTAYAWKNVWNGTGGVYPEGPHIYKKDGLYYLLIAEGGTEANHSVTIARSIHVTGPYESYSKNPILTNRNTEEYFQTIGHADLFQDKKANWWGVALATRSGPEWEIYPMGRETVLYPADWEEGAWPALQPARGSMTGPLPEKTSDVAGTGPFANDGEDVEFKPGSKLPKTFQTWRPQPESLFTISPPGHASTLRITPSVANLTGSSSFAPGSDSISFISRVQTATLFNYSVDVLFEPRVEGEEAGISVFLTQQQHIDLAIKHVRTARGKLSRHFVFRVEASGLPGFAIPEPIVSPIPQSWLNKAVTLSVSTPNDASFSFYVALSSNPKQKRFIGEASARIVSGGSGPFTGTILGSYATSNGGKGNTPSYLSKWRYEPIAQEIADGVYANA